MMVASLLDIGDKVYKKEKVNFIIAMGLLLKVFGRMVNCNNPLLINLLK